MLKAPEHIRGPLPQDAKGRRLAAERAAWIYGLPRSYSNRQIARALGVSQSVVCDAVPERRTRFDAGDVHISLPPVPGVVVTPDRPETAARTGIKRMPPPRVTVSDVVEIIRQEWIRTRAMG